MASFTTLSVDGVCWHILRRLNRFNYAFVTYEKTKWKEKEVMEKKDEIEKWFQSNFPDKVIIRVIPERDIYRIVASLKVPHKKEEEFFKKNWAKERLKKRGDKYGKTRK
jgi:hypothetical protein